MSIEIIFKTLLVGVTISAFIYGWCKLFPGLKILRREEGGLSNFKSPPPILNRPVRLSVTQMDIRRTLDATKAAVDFSTVTQFENAIAEFFGAPYAVATDGCTHALELCLRYTKPWIIEVPRHTYLSVPMLANKLRINLLWKDEDWQDYYEIAPNVMDAAVLWRRDSYIPGKFMCVSFQHQKHLKIGRAGVILCDNKEAADALRAMAYDGRSRSTPWREQVITTMGFHYYMTPEAAALGLQLLPEAIATQPRQWVLNDWPDISVNPVFKKQNND